MKPWLTRTFILSLGLVMCLSITPPRILAQETADLALTKGANRSKVRVGESIEYTLTLTNLGPGVATDVVFGDPLPDQLNLVSFSCSTGTISGGPFCRLDSLASGATATATVVATPDVNKNDGRRITNTAFIMEAGAFDPNEHNNAASVIIKVIGNIPR